ncbi:dephospho-CoA kinase [Bartonella sp. B41]
MKIIGLTGSIAMGKSTVADFFKEAGISVFSADEIIHQLYDSEPTLSFISRIFPDAIENGKVNRLKLSEIFINDSKKLQTFEKMIHPLVENKEREFICEAHKQKKKLVVLDIPLLFETNSENRVDSIVVVSASFKIQKERAMIRQNMSEKKFEFINSRQIPDEKKRKLADFIIDTGKNLESTRQQVFCVIESLLKN